MTHLGVGSVVRVALALYLLVLAAFLVAGVILWQLAIAAGVIRRLDHLATSLGFGTLAIHGAPVLAGAALVGLSLVLLAVVSTALGAILFNLVAPAFGGIRVRGATEESRPVGRNVV